MVVLGLGPCIWLLLNCVYIFSYSLEFFPCFNFNSYPFKHKSPKFPYFFELVFSQMSCQNNCVFFLVLSNNNEAAVFVLFLFVFNFFFNSRVAWANLTSLDVTHFFLNSFQPCQTDRRSFDTNIASDEDLRSPLFSCARLFFSLPRDGCKVFRQRVTWNNVGFLVE